MDCLIEVLPLLVNGVLQRSLEVLRLLRPVPELSYQVTRGVVVKRLLALLTSLVFVLVGRVSFVVVLVSLKHYFVGI